jgi:drug/metabolite transporter (DMT)-like permease
MSTHKFPINDSTANLLNVAIEVEENSDLNKERTQNDIKPKHFRGILIALVAAFCFALFGILNKEATFVTGSEQSSIRYFMQIILMIIIAKYNKESLVGPKEQRKLLLIRGVFGACSFISFGFSIKYIDESSAQALYNARLVIIPLLAVIFLKEKLKIVNIFCFVLTIIGVVLICEPTFSASINNSTSTNKSNFEIKSTPNVFDYVGIGMGLLSAVAI